MASRRRYRPADGFDWVLAAKVGAVMIAFAIWFLVLIYYLLR